MIFRLPRRPRWAIWASVDWLAENSDALLQAGRLLFEFLLIIAALTPTDWDDNALARAKNLFKVFTSKGSKQ